MKKADRIALTILAAIMLLAVGFILSPAVAQARSVTVLEGAKFDTASSIKDNLKTFAGRDVVVHLRSGKSFQGHVKATGDHFIHLEKLSGRDFYDALIRIEDISAIEAKFRELK